MNTTGWSSLRKQLFDESQWHRQHTDEIAALYNARPSSEQWHLSRYVNHYNCVYLNLEDMGLHIDTVSTQIVALCTRSIIENYITLQYLNTDPNGTGQADYDSYSIVGYRDVENEILTFLSRTGAISDDVKDKKLQDSEKTTAEKVSELNITKTLPKKSSLNYRNWAALLKNEPSLLIDYDGIHKISSKFVHPSPMSSCMMQPNVDERFQLHEIFGSTALKYSRLIVKLLDSIFKP